MTNIYGFLLSELILVGVFDGWVALMMMVFSLSTPGYAVRLRIQTSVGIVYLYTFWLSRRSILRLICPTRSLLQKKNPQVVARASN